MSDPQPLRDDAEVAADAKVAAENRRIAAVILVALAGATILALAAGQVFAAGDGCGEPGAANAASLVGIATVAEDRVRQT